MGALRAVLLCFFLGHVAGQPGWQTAVVRCESQQPAGHQVSSLAKFNCQWSHGTGGEAKFDALARFQDAIEDSGWARLHVRGFLRQAAASGHLEHLRVAYAAGFLEGALTAEPTWQHRSSYYEATFKDATAPSGKAYTDASEFLASNDAWVRRQIRRRAGSDPYWAEVELVWSQLDGLVAGNAAGCRPGRCLGLLDFLFLQAEEDLSSVIHKPFAAGDWTPAVAAEYTRAGSHCSSVIRMTPGNADLLMGHNTWTGYYSMLRVLKGYDLPLPRNATRAAFPGYFGKLYSGDDFYTLSSGLTVQETTNSLYNATTAAMIRPESVLTWARTIVANRNAADGRSWAAWFSPFNSGTINNQWQVVSMGRFTPGRPPPDGTLTVLEQMPGTIVWADRSDVLREQGWWASFNSPYFGEVRQASGADDMERRFGDAYSYTRNPRARIFARDMPKARDMASVKALLRYNDWQNDPLSAKGYEGPEEPRAPENAIAARYDLHPWPNVTRAFGNTDGKICAARGCLALRFDAVSGPTADQQPAFAWRGRWADSPHYGQPEVFDFGWVSFGAELPAASASDAVAFVI